MRRHSAFLLCTLLALALLLTFLTLLDGRARIAANPLVTDYPVATCNEAGFDSALAAALADAGEARVTFAVCPAPAAIILLTSVKNISSDVIVDGDEKIMLRGNGSTGLFNVQPLGNLTLRRLVLARGNANNGGAVIVSNASELYVDHSIFTNNTAATNGGAIHAVGGEVTIEGSIFLSNTAAATGGAFNTINNSVTISGTYFQANSAESGGAVAASQTEAWITDTTFFVNRSDDHGGALYILGSSATDNLVTVLDARFQANRADESGLGTGGGGGVYAQGATLNMTGAEFINNSASFAGGVRLAYAEGTISASRFNGNQASGIVGEGGAIGLFDSEYLISSSAFISNTSSGHGGAIRIYQSSTATQIPRIVGSTFYNNVSNTQGSAIHAFKAGASNSVAPMHIENSTFHQSGGANEAIYSSKLHLDLLHVTITDNPLGIELDGSTALTLTNSALQNTMNCDIASTGLSTTFFTFLDGGACGLIGSGTLSTTASVLGPFQDNGGGPRTRLPLPGALIVDSADAAACLPTDQRGVARPDGAGCDMGATELTGLTPPTATPTHTFTAIPTEFPSPTATHTPTATSTSPATQTAVAATQAFEATQVAVVTQTAAATQTSIAATQTAQASTTPNASPSPSGTPPAPNVYLNPVSAPSTATP